MYSWMIMVTSSPDGVPLVLRPALQRVRKMLTDGFVASTPIDDAARRWITRACEMRLADPNARDDERARVRAIAAAHGLPG
jgi:hypothetical protein